MIGRYRLNAYELHKHLINEYVLKNPGNTKLLKRDNSKDKTDYDVIRENHQFVWGDDDNSETWEKKLAKKYFDKLFKEYTIADLSLYKQNKLALRWRVEKEVILGKGQFTCGEKTCNNDKDLKSWEVNFAYVEQGQKKNTLVKLRLCPSCSTRLNYKSKKREIKRLNSFKEKRKEEKSSSSSNDTVSQNNITNFTVTKSSPLNLEQQVKEKCSNCWTETNIEDKTREEEFDGYLEDLLL